MLVAELAARFKSDGMLAYVNMIQKREKEIGCDVLTHQKWYVSVDHPLDASPTEHLFQERRKLHRREPQRRLGRLVKHVGDWW